MSTRDPSKDEYLELETRLGRAEQTLAADLADADEELAGASHELARAGSGVASKRAHSGNDR